jgi:tRNA-splicing ligase RtcB
MAQEAIEIYDPKTAEVFGLHPGQVVVGVRSGARGLGYQIGTEFLRDMAIEAAHKTGLAQPEQIAFCEVAFADIVLI